MEQSLLFVLFNPIRTGGMESYPPYGFLPSTKKIFRQSIPEIFLLISTFGCGYPYQIFVPQKFSLHPLTALLGHLVQKYVI